MASNTTVREVLRRVSSLLQDDDPQFTRYSETSLVDAVMDAERAIHEVLPASCSRIDSLKLKPGTLQSIEDIVAANCILFDGTTPAANIKGSLFITAICNMGAGATPGRAIRPVEEGREALDAIDPTWHTSVDVVVKHFVFDPATPRHFLVVPGVHATTPVWARISYVAMPLLIPNTGTPGAPVYGVAQASTVKLSVHDEHVADVVSYVCARALMANAQFASATGMKASDYAAMFTASLNAKATAILGYNPNLKHLPQAAGPVGAAS